MLFQTDLAVFALEIRESHLSYLCNTLWEDNL